MPKIYIFLDWELTQAAGNIRAEHYWLRPLFASRWAYMVMASVAWSLKAWSALWLPEAGRWKDRRHSEKFKLLKMEFRTFVNTIIRIPCQILTTGRRTVYRLLAWNDSQPIFWRMVAVLNL